MSRITDWFNNLDRIPGDPPPQAHTGVDFEDLSAPADLLPPADPPTITATGNSKGFKLEGIPIPEGGAPEEIREAAKTILAWVEDEQKRQELEAYDAKPKVVTTGEWEGLQFELSFLKDQMAEAQAFVHHGQTQAQMDNGSVDGVEVTSAQAAVENAETLEDLVEALGDRNAEVRDAMGRDWGLDDNWTERRPQNVNLQEAPDGLYIGPFVLLTPEERTMLASALSDLDVELEAYQKRTNRTLSDWEGDVKRWRGLVGTRDERIEMLEAALRHRDATIAALTEDAPTIRTKTGDDFPPLPQNFMGSFRQGPVNEVQVRPKPRGGIANGPGNLAQRSVDEEDTVFEGEEADYTDGAFDAVSPYDARVEDVWSSLVEEGPRG